MMFPARFDSSGEAETRAVGKALASELRPGDVVALSGPLGAGKTVFVRGLAEGLGGDPDDVASPTFALLHEYDCSSAALVHLDLYRLPDDEKELRELGLPDLLEGKVAAVEWPNQSVGRVLRIGYRVSLMAGEASHRYIQVERAQPGPR